ncbi:MAG: cupin domain-containing protein [Phycisphaerales bacterium JB040]
MPSPATLHDWSDLPTDRPMPLISRQRVVGEHMMLSRVTLEPGFSVPVHAHANEQIAVVLEGSITFTLEEDSGTRELHAAAGQCVVLPPNLPHGATTEDGCVILDCFSPPSETTGVDAPSASNGCSPNN